MQTRRAEEIIISPEITDVFYKEKPVWIRTLDKESNSAAIHIFGDDQALEVPVAELYEAEEAKGE